jgi:hypothetical protein
MSTLVNAHLLATRVSSRFGKVNPQSITLSMTVYLYG